MTKMYGEGLFVVSNDNIRSTYHYLNQVERLQSLDKCKRLARNLSGQAIVEEFTRTLPTIGTLVYSRTN